MDTKSKQDARARFLALAARVGPLPTCGLMSAEPPRYPSVIVYGQIQAINALLASASGASMADAVFGATSRQETRSEQSSG